MSLNPLIKDRASGTRPAGRRKGGWTALLEQGANVLQTTAPLKRFDVYVVGFHCAKRQPQMQMEAHHFCKVVNEDLLQCVVFDGNTADANLIGLEYIVSGELFDTLPEQERPLWHPHNYEVFSGTLCAPGLPQAAERRLMEHLVNSYGKTWHTWHTGAPGSPGTDLPLGEATLMWSFNREGETDPALEQDLAGGMGLDFRARHEERRRLLPLARPQHGVDAMRADFPGSTPVPGVVDAAGAGGSPASG